MTRTPEAVVVIPARNESRRIADCLHALAAQATEDLAVVLVANDCDDDTSARARDVANGTGLSFELLDCALPRGAGVGTARRLGCERALALWPEAQLLLTTDADCRPAPDWIARTRMHLAQVSAVCGEVRPMSAEISVLYAMEIWPAELESRYETLVMDFYRHFRPGPFGLDGDHGCAAGASLAFHVASYRAVGGFRDFLTGEDRDLVRRFKSAGIRVRHAGDVRVEASCRLDGRARGGMAKALRARAERTDYLIDEALPPAKSLIKAALNGTLGPWPLQVPAGARLRARELAPHLETLQAAWQAVQDLRVDPLDVPGRAGRKHRAQNGMSSKPWASLEGTDSAAPAPFPVNARCNRAR